MHYDFLTGPIGETCFLLSSNLLNFPIYHWKDNFYVMSLGWCRKWKSCLLASIRLILQPLDIYQASRYRSKKVLLDHYCKRKKRKEGESPVKTVIEPFHCVLSNKKVDLISTEKELIFCFFDLQELLYLFISLGFVCTIYNSLVCLIFHLEKHAENPQWLVVLLPAAAVVILTLQQSILEGKKLFKKKR